MFSFSRSLLAALCVVGLNSVSVAAPAPPNVEALPVFNDGFVLVYLPRQPSPFMRVCPSGLMYFESRPNGVECAVYDAHTWNGGYIEGSQRPSITPQAMLDEEFKNTVTFVGIGPYGTNNRAVVYYRIKRATPPAVTTKSVKK